MQVNVDNSSKCLRSIFLFPKLYLEEITYTSMFPSSRTTTQPLAPAAPAAPVSQQTPAPQPGAVAPTAEETNLARWIALIEHQTRSHTVYAIPYLLGQSSSPSWLMGALNTPVVIR